MAGFSAPAHATALKWWAHQQSRGRPAVVQLPSIELAASDLPGAARSSTPTWQVLGEPLQTRLWQSAAMEHCLVSAQGPQVPPQSCAGGAGARAAFDRGG